MLPTISIWGRLSLGKSIQIESSMGIERMIAIHGVSLWRLTAKQPITSISDNAISKAIRMTVKSSRSGAKKIINIRKISSE
ncbi:MAG: hypothetical protein DRH07_10770 [Deltaproteobacteria bacterium]|nr:MAG: hypothetical protein DRH07_10770 [Deltaproteobacteria bacterium]